MARASINVSLAEFELVVAAMRARGVAQWNNSPIGDVTLGPAPLSARMDKADKDPKAQRRIYYSEVFGRNVTDAELEKLP